MDFVLEISRDNSVGSYRKVDLFPNQQLEYDLDFYDSLEVDKVKLPFYTKLRIPLTDTNKASDRFNFDPAVTDANSFPREDFYFKINIYGGSTTEIIGILNVESFEYNSSQSYIEVELKDFLSKYISDLKDKNLSVLYDDAYYTTSRTMSEFLQPEGTGAGEAGTIGQNPDYSRPIAFPFVDFCNDVNGKFGYAARQFLEYGPGLHRGGIAPVFNVRSLLTLIGSYIDTSLFPVRVDSKLFEVGAFAGSTGLADFDPEKLHLVTPARLMAKQDTNTRNFFLRQAPAWTGTNRSLETCSEIDGSSTLIHSGYFGNMETAGNYGTDAEGNPISSVEDWGSEKRANFYPDDNDEGIRGFFAPKVSFNAGIALNSGATSVNVEGLKYELPVMEQDKMVEDIIYNDPQSTLRLKMYVGIYEDGFMIKKIPLKDSLGDDILLDMSSVTVATEGNSNKDNFSQNGDFFSCVDGDENQPAFIGNGVIYRDTLNFGVVEANFPQGEEIMINSGSQYSINYFLEPFDGDLVVQYVSAYTSSGSGNGKKYFKAANNTAVFSFEDIYKAITRVDNYGELNIKFTANQDFLPYKTTDRYVIKDSIEQTCPLNVTEVLSAILKRFDCGLFYEYDSSNTTHVLRVDPIAFVRTGSQGINNYVDDIKSVKIFNGGDKVKTLEINNKDYGLYFDDVNNDGVTIGSTIQEINSEGISEIKIDLESSVYYKSVCGDEADNSSESTNLGAFSEKELGFTPNVFTKNKDVGLRFAYLDKPLYKTNLLTPHTYLRGFRQDDKMNTESQIIFSNSPILSLSNTINGQHIFNGRLFHYNTAGWNLLFEKEDETTGDAYTDIFATSEKIVHSEKSKIQFDMVVPTSDLATLDFFLQTLSATRFTPNDILVKSATGEVYDNYAYLTIEGILQ